MSRKEALKYARRVCALLRSDLPLQLPPDTFAPISAAYVRSLALLRSMITLAERWLDDVMGTVHRTLLETGYVGIYMRGGPEVGEALLRHDFAEQCAIARKMGAPEPDWNDWEGFWLAFGWSDERPTRKRSRLTPEDIIAAAVEARRGMNFAPFVEGVTVEYAFVGHQYVHASMSSIAPHYLRRGDEATITSKSRAAVLEAVTTQHLLHASLMVLVLASFVYSSYDTLDEKKIVTLLDEGFTLDHRLMDVPGSQ